jgi:hypothetical protein
LSQPLTQAFGQAFVMENRVGANGIIAMEALAKAAPDGHVLCFTQGAPISLNPYFYSKLPYDPQRDFSPVVNVGVIAASIVGAADQPANNLRELIEQARSKPDSVVWATWGSGSFSDLYRAWAENSFGVRFREVPYKTSEQAFNAVLRGEAHVLLNASGMLAPHVKAGKIKALGTIGARRLHIERTIDEHEIRAAERRQGRIATARLALGRGGTCKGKAIQRFQAGIFPAFDLGRRQALGREPLPMPKAPALDKDLVFLRTAQEISASASAMAMFINRGEIRHASSR